MLVEISDLKVQVAVLVMIADISGNKKSASAFESVVKKVSGIVVGIACSGVGGERDAYVNTHRGLISIDLDLIWLLLADVNTLRGLLQKQGSYFITTTSCGFTTTFSTRAAAFIS